MYRGVGNVVRISYLGKAAFRPLCISGVLIRSKENAKAAKATLGSYVQTYRLSAYQNLLLNHRRSPSLLLPQLSNHLSRSTKIMISTIVLKGHIGR